MSGFNPNSPPQAAFISRMRLMLPMVFDQATGYMNFKGAAEGWDKVATRFLSEPNPEEGLPLPTKSFEFAYYVERAMVPKSYPHHTDWWDFGYDCLQHLGLPGATSITRAGNKSVSHYVQNWLVAHRSWDSLHGLLYPAIRDYLGADVVPDDPDPDPLPDPDPMPDADPEEEETGLSSPEQRARELMNVLWGHLSGDDWTNVQWFDPTRVDPKGVRLFLTRGVELYRQIKGLVS